MVKDSGISDIIGVILLIAVVTASMGIVGIMITRDINPVKVPHMGFLACNNSAEVFLYHTGGDAIIPDQFRSDIEIRFLDADKRAIQSEWLHEPWLSGKVLNYSYTSGAQYIQVVVPSGSGDSLIEWTYINPCVGTYIPRPGPGPGPGPGGPCTSVSISGTITESGTGNPAPGITVNAYYEGDHATRIGTTTSGSDGSYEIILPVTGILERYDIHCPDAGTWQTTNPVSGWYNGIVIDQSSGSGCEPGGYVFVGTFTVTPGLTVEYPNGGERFAVGSVQTISWTLEHMAPDHFLIEYFDGTTWHTINTHVSGALRIYSWTVPNTPTDQALVRVTARDSSGNTITVDTSDNVFTIYNPDCYRISGQVLNQATGNPVDGIRVNAYYEGDSSTIIGHADTTGDGRYTILLPPTGNIERYNIHCPDTGTWETTVPASKWHYGIVIDPLSSTLCHPDGVDFQGIIIHLPVLNVISPNGGEDWVIGTDHQITWSAENVNAASYTIQYSTDEGANWILIDDAVSGSAVSYSWTVSGPPTDLALVRVIAKNGSGTSIIEDQSDNVFTISAPCTKTITASAGSGGLIDPIGAITVPCGDDLSFTITPDGCYTIQDVLVDGVSVGQVSTYTFEKVQEDHTIEVLFSIKTFTITATDGEGGSISPSGSVTVDCGSEPTFTITPDTGYEILDVLVNGTSIGPVPTYTFPPVMEDGQTIDSIYIVDCQSPVASFTAVPSSGNAPLTVQFTNTSSSSSPITSWEWNFGDGSDNSTVEKPVHTYSAGGTYPVILTVYNSCGSSASATGTITVTDCPPVTPSFTYTKQTNPRERIFFDDFEASFSGWSQSGTVNGRYTGTPKYGDYAVELRSNGRIWRTISTLEYSDIIVSFAMGALSLEGTENVRAEWSANNGGSWTTLAQINRGGDDGQLHDFSFTLPLVVTDNDQFVIRFILNAGQGNDYGYVDNVEVTGIPTSITYQFTDTSTSSIPITAWNWSFGDGTANSTLQHPDHTYSSEGSYRAILTAMNECGNNASISKRISTEDNYFFGQWGRTAMVPAGRYPVNRIRFADSAAGGYGSDMANWPVPIIGRADNFSVRYDADLTITEGAVYTFYLTSDDGSWFWLNGNQIIDNGGLHAPRMNQTSLYLAPDTYPIQVKMFENTGQAVLHLEYSSPTMARQFVNADFI